MVASVNPPKLSALPNRAAATRISPPGTCPPEAIKEDVAPHLASEALVRVLENECPQTSAEDRAGTCMNSMVPFINFVMWGALAITTPVAPPDPSVDAIIRRSAAANEADWRLESRYDHCERDDDGDTTRTYDVTMMEGTPYERLVAVDGRLLPPDKQRDEQQKLQREAANRRVESPSQRAKRVGKYTEKHARVLRLFRQMADAFLFELKDTRSADGRTAYVIAATPRPGYKPPTRDARALTGMTAEFWIDTTSYHWIKAVAQVTRPVSIVGVLVRIEPGTTVAFEKAPVVDGTWLMTHLLVRSSSRVLLLFGHHTYEDERYFDYRRSSVPASSGCIEGG
jgi:hypothetical protein